MINFVVIVIVAVVFVVVVFSWRILITFASLPNSPTQVTKLAITVTTNYISSEWLDCGGVLRNVVAATLKLDSCMAARTTSPLLILDECNGCFQYFIFRTIAFVATFFADGTSGHVTSKACGNIYDTLLDRDEETTSGAIGTVDSIPFDLLLVVSIGYIPR